METKEERDKKQVRKIATTQLWLCLLQYLPILLVAVLCCVPFVQLDYPLYEGKLSILDVLCSTASPKSFKEFTASSIAADFFSIPIEDYENFFKSLLYGMQSVSPDDGVADVLTEALQFGIRFFSLLCAAFFLVKSFLGTLINPFKWSVSGALRSCSAEKFYRFFSRNGFDESNGLYFKTEEKEPALASKATKKSYVKWTLAFVVIFVIALYFPVQLLIFISKERFLSLSPIFTVFCVVCLVTVAIANTLERYYATKYAGTLSVCRRLKKSL